MSIVDTDDVSDVGIEIVRDLTAFQHNILVVLAEGPEYGLGIKRELEDYYGEEVNHGRLYPNLDTLVDMGLIEKSERDKRTNEYALTEAGEAALGDRIEWTFSKLLTDEDRAEDIRSVLEQQS